MFGFAYPWVLIFLLLLPLLYWYIGYVQRRPSLIFSTAKPFKKIRAKSSHNIVSCLFLLALSLLIVALARPRYGNEKVTFRTKGIDIIIAIDMSGSMSCFDLPKNEKPQNIANLIQRKIVKRRIDVAKEEIRRFIQSRPNDRIGLIGFADQAYNFAPPTLDHEWLIERLEMLELGEIGDLTGIASPIGSATNRLKNSTSKRRVLMLFTDGMNTAENRVTPIQAAQIAKDFKVVIHTVGIGGGNAYALNQNYQIYRVHDGFDENLLKSLSKKTEGNYFHAADATGFRNTMDEINKLEKTTVEQPKYIEYHEYSPLLSGIVLLFLLCAYIMDNSWKMRLP